MNVPTQVRPAEAASAVDPAKIEAWIAAYAELSSAPPGTPGVTRLAFTPLERRAHAVFAAHMKDLGAEVVTDAVGNTIATLRGSEPTARPLGTGSHLDSVPSGGRFDGIAGVVAAMEVARVVGMERVARRRDWQFVAFAAEEGARFGQACIGSRVIAGMTTAGDLAQLTDADGVTAAQAMTASGLRPAQAASARWDPGALAAFLELHIEQGNLLEQLDLPVGVVDCISGSTRLRVDLHGLSSHTGGTPMHLRHDALAAAAECVLAAEELATDPHHRGTRMTVGTMTVAPGSMTTIPGEVSFSIDIRDIDSDRQRAAAHELTGRLARIAERRGVRIDVEVLADTSPVVLPTWLAERSAAAARELGLGYRVMPSGASHDSQMISRVVPVGMVFVPSAGGISHSPDEWTSAGQIAAGTSVLLRTLLALDAEPDA